MKYLLTICFALFLSIGSPVAADPVDKVGDALEDADREISEFLDGSILEKIFSLDWLNDIGDWYGKRCADIGGEWDPSVPECRK